ncbi:hypothetical protein CRT60_21180 [Azospirillum palustre]|uniref:Uncharacterized protein n=1 Tax=Azospirillum palustre TaxID=2044885 RepID=A0A2B8BDC5_9PROT|nr:hypothetical protein [Azospirillum palustre]PGH55780.1 hypothetical protein CRT60_21180 [Azospirillum palustre]
MGNGIRIFAALDGDLAPVLACGWLLSMNPGVTVTAGPPDRGPGAGLCARGYMDLHVLTQDHGNDALVRTAALQARRLAALLPGEGALDLGQDPPVGRFDLLLAGRPRPGKPSCWSADAQRFGAVLVAPRETPSHLGRSIAILADGPPRALKSFRIAQRLFPAIASVHLILDERTDPGRADEWLRQLDCRCPVRLSTVRLSTVRPTADAQSAASLDAGGDLLVVERPTRFWTSIGFEWRLAALLDRTPGAVLFAR